MVYSCTFFAIIGTATKIVKIMVVGIWKRLSTKNNMNKKRGYVKSSTENNTES